MYKLANFNTSLHRKRILHLSQGGIFMTIGANYNTWISNQKNAQSTFRYANNHENCKQGALKLAQSRISLVDINKNKGMDTNEFEREQHRLFPAFQIEATSLFEKADVNRDRVLDAEELATIYLVADYLDGQIDGEIDRYEALIANGIETEEFNKLSPQDFLEIKNGWYPTQIQE